MGQQDHFQKICANVNVAENPGHRERKKSKILSRKERQEHKMKKRFSQKNESAPF